MPERLLLCTDLDRTLLPNGPQPESPGARERFALLAGNPKVVVTYVSGRHRELVEEAVIDYSLPSPDYVIGDVGTSIYRPDAQSNWVLNEDWDREIGRDWGDKSNSDLQQLLLDIGPLQTQEQAKQNRRKLSYYVPLVTGQIQDQQQLTRTISRRLQQHGISARQVWSIDIQANTGLLDILPARAGKYQAIAWLQASLGFNNDNTVFSGDSGNDMEVLASPIPAILVANSEKDVQMEALRLAGESANSEHLYIARGGCMGMNGNYSAGILEGIVHYHPAIASWLLAGATI